MNQTYQYILLLGACLLSTINMQATELDSGLYFHAYEVSAANRTSLQLEGGKPIALTNQFELSFDLNLRNNESIFGAILHLTFDDTTAVHLMLVIDENNHIYPALVLNDQIHYLKTPLHRQQWVPVSLRLDRKMNQIKFSYAQAETSVSIPLHNFHSSTITFGRLNSFGRDVVPMNVRNISLAQNGKQVRLWKLGKHNGNICQDEIMQSPAISESPYWLMDNHMEWQLVYSTTSTEPLLAAFDARKTQFYFIKKNVIEVYDHKFALQRRHEAKDNYSITDYNSHCLFDTLTNQLVAYSLISNKIARFSFETNEWCPIQDNKYDVIYNNHAYTFNPTDSAYYFFGGYGHFTYHNDLFRWKVDVDTLQKINYEPQVYPRFAAAMTAYDNKLYILGGRGNKLGRQVVESYFYYDLWRIDLDSKQAVKLWDGEEKYKDKVGCILSSSMYFNPTDSCLYVVNMDDEGGKLVCFNLHNSNYTVVSHAIRNFDEYQDFDYKLCYSAAQHKFYLMIDKILSDHSHKFFIYAINTPLLSEEDILQPVPSHTWDTKSVIIILLLSFSILLICAFWYRRRIIQLRNAPSSLQEPEQTDDNTTIIPISEKEENNPSIEGTAVIQNYYDRSRSAVSMLGPFRVCDRNGKDITLSFTPRLKELLLLLILHSEKDTRGISVKRLTELLWFDKEDNQARNNRNVTVRKLRVLLETVGDVDIVNENGTMRIEWGEVFCDYHEMLTCIRGLDINGKIDDGQLNRILELLLYGSLLPNSTIDWLDDFKTDYSSLSVDLLKQLLTEAVKEGNLKKQQRIADIMFLHDSLSEEALAAKCIALFKEGKKGIAKKLYDRFCKEYQDTLDEPYKVAFTDLENLCN